MNPKQHPDVIFSPYYCVPTAFSALMLLVGQQAWCRSCCPAISTLLYW